MKYSRQRSIILNIVRSSYDHPTAEEVYEEARRELPSIGIATVYRNLNQLAETGDVVRISLPSGNDRYDGQLEEHYHLCCTECGCLQDIYPVSDEQLEELRRFACKTFKVRQKGIVLSNLLLEGVCKDCLGTRS